MSMNAGSLLRYGVHLLIDGKEREIHIESEKMQVSSSGVLEFYVSREGRAEPVLHFCVASGGWRGCWLLSDEKTPVGVVSNSVLTSDAIAQEAVSKESRTEVPLRVGAALEQVSGPQAAAVSDSPQSPSFAVVPVGSFRGNAKGAFQKNTSNMGMPPQEGTLPESTGKAPEIKKEETTLQILTPEQRIAQYLSKHQYLGLSSLSATLDIPVDMLERYLWQLCKDKKIPMSYLSLPAHQEELQKYMPDIMALGPKKIGEIMVALEKQELGIEVESFQVHIWLHNNKKQKDQKGKAPSEEKVDLSGTQESASLEGEIAVGSVEEPSSPQDLKE